MEITFASNFWINFFEDEGSIEIVTNTMNGDKIRIMCFNKRHIEEFKKAVINSSYNNNYKK